MLEFPIIPNQTNSNLFDIMLIENEYYPITISTLIDTGASFPVWMGLPSIFKNSFPNAVKINSVQAIIRGFGGSGEIADVYKIPKFYLQDSQGNNVCFEDMPVVISIRDYSIDMILSYPLVRKMNFSHLAYSNKNGQYKPRNPRIRLHPYKNTYKIIMTNVPTTTITDINIRSQITAENILKNIDIFSQI